MTGSKFLILQQESGIKHLAEQCLMSPTRAKPTNPLLRMKKKVSATYEPIPFGSNLLTTF